MCNKTEHYECYNDCARRFRDLYPGYDFSTIGYNVAPPKVMEDYLKLVEVEVSSCIRGPVEQHRCHRCREVIYSEIFT